MQIGGGEFRKSISALTLVRDASIFLHMPDQFLEKNEKGAKFDPFRVLPSQNIRMYLKNFI